MSHIYSIFYDCTSWLLIADENVMGLLKIMVIINTFFVLLIISSKILYFLIFVQLSHNINEIDKNEHTSQLNGVLINLKVNLFECKISK